MRLDAIGKHPGLFRDAEGHIVNMADFHPFETSIEVFPQQTWEMKTEDSYVLHGWHFTLPELPQDRRLLQQVVELKWCMRVIVTRNLATITTVAGEPRQYDFEKLRDVYLKPPGYLEVRFREHAVEKLRLHLYGMRRTLVY